MIPDRVPPIRTDKVGVQLYIGTYMPIKYIMWTATAMVWCNMVAMRARHK